MKSKALKKTYGGRLVLDIPSLELEEGKTYSIVGANGSGKSTLAKILAGIVDSDDGSCALEGAGYMAQKSYAFNMSLEKNIMINGDDSGRCKELMKALGILSLAESKAKTLSGGEMAKMALARIMMKDYKVLILDEPTAAMDKDSVLLAESMIAEYSKKTQCVTILITHSMEQAKRMSDEIIEIDYGKLIKREVI